MSLNVKRVDCEPGCRLILQRAISYAEAAEHLFSSGLKQEAYVLSFLAMDECGKFLLICKEMQSNEEPLLHIQGFLDHRQKLSEFLEYYRRIAGSSILDVMKELIQNSELDLSQTAKLAYQALLSGAYSAEAIIVDANPLRMRNAAYYIDYDSTWKNTRYPGDELCAAQIKLVKGTAKSYLKLIQQNGLDFLLGQTHLFI